MTISKLSLDDINKVRAESSEPRSFSAVNSTPATKKESSFVSRLTDNQIAAFFEPYGLVSFEKIEDNGQTRAIYVRCVDFMCAFSDYDVIVWVNTDPFESQKAAIDYLNQNKELPKFNLESFKLYCESIETTPEKAIESRITTELLGGLKKYDEAYSNFMPKRLNEIFDEMPSDYQELLGSALQDQLLIARKKEIQTILDKYGSYENIEALISKNQ